MNIFNIIVGCSNIIACIISIISLIKVSQINKKVNSDNRSQKVNIKRDNKKDVTQIIGSNNDVK